LQDIHLTLHQGEIVALLGVSGAGKTTLFNVIAGLLQPTAGHVLLKGQDITGKTGQVSYMLQKDLLLPFRTIASNVALPLLLQGVPKKVALAKADPYFETFGLSGTQQQYPGALSGGMRQRAALLRTYLAGKEVALLDEPFSALDEITKRHLYDWYLQVMTQIKLTTLLVTHSVDEALVLADRIYLMTGQPSHMSEAIVLPPRDERGTSFELTTTFLNYKREILAKLA
jgi:ABC-type nitrate/sulfonate/bicarbonate transport system ATPase subunit